MYNKILIVSFCLCIFSVGIISSIITDKDFSNNENRNLTKFPSFSFDKLYNGSYTKDVENYVSDNVIFRDEFVSLKTLSQLAIGKKDNTRVYFGEDGRLFEINKDINLEDVKKNVNILNNFTKKIYENYNIKTELMLVPTATLIYNNMLPKNSKVNDEEKYILDIYNKFNFKSINVIDKLKQNTNQDLYFKLDHHWTQNGAYLAYEKWKEVTNINENISYSKQKVADDFYGSLYSKANNYLLKPDNIDIYINNNIKYNVVYDKEKITNDVYEMNNLNKKDKYTVFLDGNHSIVDITTNVNNDKKLLVIKDSYAHNLIPLLSNHYNKITVLDLRYINGDIKEYIQDMKGADCLFIYNIYNFTNKNELDKLNLK
ncbi:MAG: DHHW family protein [Clostridia bacterium]